jgi:tetratricopeptide (TPR) repeat protein
MPRFVLISMVKNEEKILKRCLDSVEGLVDAYCITDTCSTDTTTDIATDFLKTHEGCLEISSWKHFGHNRTVSFKNAQDYCKSKQWDLKDTYGLLLDADMKFVQGDLKQQALGELGYTIVQVAGSIEYPNTRLVRMDYDWVCKGVTHEYWDGISTHLSKSVCHIDDLNDGGSKGDKFPRDLALLEKGLKEEPTNVRYMFYLAQTHHSMGNHEKAIEHYIKRIEAGGWQEEIWYSHYMIAKSYASLNKPFQFEEWVEKAYDMYPHRAEAMYALTKYYREKGQPYKAYHYLQIGKSIPLPNDSLFIETDVYNGLFDYEQTILDYYVKSDPKEGLHSCVRYMLKMGYFHANVVANLKFYAKPVNSVRTRLQIPSLFGDDFKPSAVSLISYPIANVRFVNYTVKDGAFITPNGLSLCENASINLVTSELISKMDESTVGLPTVPHTIRGLEDIRVYGNMNGQLEFTATVHNYEKDKVRILHGTYSLQGSYSDCVILPSPKGAMCEKNWLAVAGTNTFIYEWYPFTLLNRTGDVISTTPTPPMFSLFRGSAPPIRMGAKWWALVHIVDYDTIRKYYHCLVELSVDMRPLQITLPFIFVASGIEYCLSMRNSGSTLYCYAGINETDVSEFAIPHSEFTWVSL